MYIISLDYIPVGESIASPFCVGFPESAQYAHVILNNPHVLPSHLSDWLQLLTASQIHPKHISVTGVGAGPLFTAGGADSFPTEILIYFLN